MDCTSCCRLSREVPLSRISSTSAWMRSMLPSTTRLAAWPSWSVCCAASAARWALCATSWAAADISLIAVATWSVSWRWRSMACSERSAWADICSTSCLRSPVIPAICRTRPWIFSTKRLKEPASSPSSSWLVTGRRRVRSPSPAAMSSRFWRIWCNGRSIALATARPITSRTTRRTPAIPTILAIRVPIRSSMSCLISTNWASTPSRLIAEPITMSHFGRYRV
ncbi:hypothetical protein PAERUG_P45_London_17_VIM_2_12_12_03082 [Pseudomonas aeruginosa]|nr:hypothetical protein PAERUG_P45_London_17_VIM_2_12_12_03082 [Pseudomonas aeruginosa]CRR86426.1 hypothetical protein PAERUG_P48_London_17_VIM_2_01_13_02509 [Pseudomonas aeruginosa]CRS22359.1 hypothetical protein PAERUG_P5_London_26_VIM_2_01_09_05254 [Pseudomonas aeruginosa]